MGALSNPKSQFSRSQGDLHLARATSDGLGELTMPLEQLLITGSDARLAIDPSTHLNVYGCAPSPRPAVISFASTTASSISPRAYAAAQSARERLARGCTDGEGQHAFDRALDEVRAALTRAFLIDDPGVEVVLAPSGTDSQLYALFIARACLGAPLTSIVVAAEETGSGTAFTTLGQHFNAQTAHCAHVMRGAPIAGLAEGLERIDIRARSNDGVARTAAQVDSDVLSAIAAARSQDRGVLLLAMDQSKSGLGGPSRDCLHFIEEQFGASVLIVVDACQGRLSREALKEHLSRGHIVLMTGSKFFTGPPFSGAVFVPPQIAERLNRNCEVPVGLGDYSGRSEWPRGWTQIRQQLPERMNIGMWLRWEAALAEITAYHTVPEVFRRAALTRFADALPVLLSEFEFCRVIDSERSHSGDPCDQTIRTIFPFLLVKSEETLTFDYARRVYYALNSDLSCELRPGEALSDRLHASTLCHIGQPLLMKERGSREIGALRLSADARLVCDAWVPGDEEASTQRIDRKIDEVRVVLQKIAIFLELTDEREGFA